MVRFLLYRKITPRSSASDHLCLFLYSLSIRCRQLLCYPRGNNKQDQFAFYLAVPSSGEEELDGWSRNAKFKLSVINQLHPNDSLVKDSHHNFKAEAVDWGFTSFCLLSELTNSARGFIVNDTIRLKVEVNVSVLDDALLYTSREDTGFVGLRNQGATCYMNSLLQTLYNVNAFRKAVYHMPTEEDEAPSQSMPLALQSVFYKLQFTAAAVSTNDLTASFGWDSVDAFQQHDVQELNRILCDRLEEKMKGTRVEGTVNHLFEGQTYNYIDCIDINFKSSRKETFQDLQLDVKGCKNIYDSFDNYCEVETLEGDNKYEAEGHGKQDARKGVLFDSLPPVLNLHLKRFEYDYQKDAMVKINDAYEFYDTLDLDRPRKDDTEGPPAYLSASADKSTSNKYKLLAVLVHSGGVHGGHYFAFIRPDGKHWLKFDDDIVSVADDIKAVNENYGGDSHFQDAAPQGFGAAPLSQMNKASNAYMLVYVRESEWDTVMCSVTEEDIGAHVRARLEAEQQEKERKRKERAEAHLYTLVRVATDEDMRSQIGRSTFFDLVDFDKVELQLKLSKKMKFSEVEREVQQRLGVSVEQQRYWKWRVRINGSHRVGDVLPSDLSDLTFTAIQNQGYLGRQSARHGEIARFDIFLETPAMQKGEFQPIVKGSALMFFKKYTPGSTNSSSSSNGSSVVVVNGITTAAAAGTTTAPKLEYAGRAVVPGSTKFGALNKLLVARADFPEGTPVEVFEEVKFDPSVDVARVDPDKTLAQINSESGDILLVQRALSEQEAATFEFPTVDVFMKHVRNCIKVTFKRIEGLVVIEDEGSTVELDLLKSMMYDDVSAALAAKLGLDDPLKIRFTPPSVYNSSLPKTIPHKYTPDISLEALLKPHTGQTSLIPLLYYEPIDIALPEYERLVTFRVAFHNEKHEETTAVTVRVLKDRSIRDMLEEVRAQLPVEVHKGAPLRLFEVYSWKIWHVFDPELPVEKHLSTSTSSSPWHLRAEIIPEDQRELDQEGQLHVQCLQVEDKDGNPKLAFAFGDPFIMAVTPGETVGQLKARVQAEMGVSDEDMATWKVVTVRTANNVQEPLSDEDVIDERFTAEDLSSKKLYAHHDRQMIGFHHENKNPRKTHAHINRASALPAQERALKIRA